MSTRVYLLSALAAQCDLWGPGTATWNPNTLFGNSGSQVVILSCRLNRGSGVASSSSATVSGGTARYQFTGSGNNFWVTPPIDRDVTIAGTVNFNLWTLESSMNANVGAACIVARIKPDGTVSTPNINDGILGTEMGTAAAAQAFSQTATSTAVKKGDRLLIVPYFSNAGGTQGSGFTCTFDYNGATASADGDSYVQFTEDFGFIQNGGATASGLTTNGSNVAIGDTTSQQRLAFTIRTPVARTLDSISVALAKIGTPTDNVEVALQADSSGAPSNTDLASASFPCTSLTGTAAQKTLDITDTALTADTNYWVVLRRSGGVDASNYPSMGHVFSDSLQKALPWNELFSIYNAGAWTASTTFHPQSVLLTFTGVTTLYPTDTTGQVNPNSVTSREMWTTVGAGATNAVVNTQAGPASQVQWTATAGGTAIEWYTRKLQAVTLGGIIRCQLQAKESNASANVSTGLEIAICNADGTGAVVWGRSLNGSEIVTTDGTVITFFVGGNDTAITAGQRLRFRFGIDDSNGANMASSFTATFVYADPTPGSLVDLAASLLEAGAGLATPPRQPHRASLDFDPFSLTGWQQSA